VALPCRVRNQQPQPEKHFLNTEIERFKTSSEPLTDIGASIWPRQTSLELMQAKIVPSLAGMLIIAKNA
jgi:hypothetical protein